MAQSINTNIASMSAQRNLNRTQMDLTTAVQRLSSGLRINSAKDDAAGIAVATRMTTQIGGLSVAIRNANDGISVAQTAEGAMAEMVTNMNRAHDLAVQAASYNTNADRTSLNQEVGQILDEMSRIVSQTRYNGDKVLSGGFSGNFQVGASVNETVNISLSDMTPTKFGVASNFNALATGTDQALADRIAKSFYQGAATVSGTKINGVTVGDFDAQTNSADKIAAINAVSSSSGVSAFSYGNGAVGVATADATATTTGTSAGALTINGVTIGAAAGANVGVTRTALVDAINEKTVQTGVTAKEVTAADGTNKAIALINRTGAAITVVNTGTDTDMDNFFASGTTSVAAGANGAIVLNGSLGTASATFGATADGTVFAGSGAATEALTDAKLNAQTVTTAASANLAMLVFEKALDSINGERSIIGAKLNRMEAVTRNLENVRENVSAARGRIQDADFAEETAKLTRAQILQQAGTAMVAQANQLPQTVLSLLK